MRIEKAIIMVNLDIDKNRELRQLALNDEEMQTLINLLHGGYIAEELKVLEKKCDSIELSNQK